MQIFPVTNAWNEDISRGPKLPNSDAMIAQIMADLALKGSGRQTLRAFQEMNFVLVPDSQPTVPISFVDFGDESDPSPYPIPTNMPIETWPSQTGTLTLHQWQQDLNDDGGDRHAIIVQPGSGYIWEMWKVDSGPAAVTFANPAQTNTTATFSAPGIYTLILSADDTVHAVAYDAAVITVAQTLTVTLARAGTNHNLNWSGGSPPYVVERSSALGTWTAVLTTNAQSATFPIAATNAFFRIRSQ